MVDTSSGSAAKQSDSAGAFQVIEYWECLIDEREAAVFVGFTVRALQGWRCRGRGPPFIKINGRCIRYRRSDLRDWAEARLRTSTSGASPETA